MRELFPPEEMDERLRLTQFITTFFTFRSKVTKDFRHPFTADSLFAIYKKSCPDTKLSAADFELYFIILGAVKETGSIFLDLNPLHSAEIPNTLLQSISPLLTTQKYRQITALPPAQVTLNIEMNGAVRFLHLFVRARDKNTKTSMQQLFSFYSLYCIQEKLPVIGRKGFAQAITRHVGPVKKGYVDGKSGTTFAQCEIPQTQMWQLSLQYGLGIFDYLGKYYDNRGKVLDFQNDEPSALTQAHITYRLTGGKNESTTTQEGSAEQEKETTSDISGRTPESSIAHVSRGEEEGDTEACDHSDEGSLSGTEEGQQDGTDSEVADGGTSEIIGGYTNGDQVIPIYADDEDDDARYEESDDKLDGDYQEKPTLKEVFAALEIAYKINPGTFDKKAMNSYLVSMDVDYAAIDIWDDFMKFVGGSK